MTSTYSRDNLASLPTDDDDLTTAFASPGDYNAVALNDGTTVDQSGSEGYALFEWKETATGNSGTFTWKGKSTKAPSESKVQLQIYKRTGTGAPVWEDVSGASNNSAAADESFTLGPATVSPLDDYKAGGTNEVALRTWQAASAPPASAWTFPDNEIDINTLITFDPDNWQDVNLTGYVPAGTKLVYLHIRNTSATTSYGADTRMNGSSDDYNPTSVKFACHVGMVAVLDGSLIFEGKFVNSALSVTIVGYSSSGGGISTRVDVTTADTSNVYVDNDVSASIPANQTAVFIAMTRHDSDGAIGFRKNGSSMDPQSVFASKIARATNVIVGVDGGIFENKTPGIVAQSLYLAAYDDHIIELADKVDVTPASDNTWTPCDASLPAGAVGALVLIKWKMASGPSLGAIRKPGTSPDNFITNVGIDYSTGVYMLVGLVDGEFEAYTDYGAGVGFYVVGYVQ